MGKTEDAWKVLGCTAKSTKDEIRKAYKAKALLVHPDKNADDPDAKKKFQELSQAYTYLMKGDDSDDSDSDWFENDEDDDLVQLLIFFHTLMRERENRYYRAMYEGDDDMRCCTCNRCLDTEDYIRYMYHGSKIGGGGGYAFACEQGEAPPKLRGKAKKTAKSQRPQRTNVREPSRKKQYKMWKAECHKERYEEERRNSKDMPHSPFHSFSNERKDKQERQPSESASNAGNDPELRETLPMPAKPKKPKPTIPQVVPKRKSKKELLAEQKRLDRERDEFREKLKQDSLKEEKRREQEKAEKEEAQKDKRKEKSRSSKPIVDPILAEQLIGSEKKYVEDELSMADTASVGSSEGNSKKSKSKRRREAKQRRRGRGHEAKDGILNGSNSQVSRLPSGLPVPDRQENEEFKWGMDGWDDEWQESSVGAHRLDDAAVSSKKEELSKKEPVIKLDHFKQTQKAKSANQDSKRSFKRDDFGSTGGSWKSRTFSNNAYYNSSKQQPNLPPHMEHQRQYNYDNGFASANAAAPPPPTSNVWYDRKEIYNAAPCNESEEEAMFLAALKLSELQAKEDEIKRQIMLEKQIAEEKLEREERLEAERRRVQREVERQAQEKELQEQKQEREKTHAQWNSGQAMFIKRNLPPSSSSPSLSMSDAIRNSNQVYSFPGTNPQQHLQTDHTLSTKASNLTTSTSCASNKHQWSSFHPEENWENELDDVDFNDPSNHSNKETVPETTCKAAYELGDQTQKSESIAHEFGFESKDSVDVQKHEYWSEEQENWDGDSSNTQAKYAADQDLIEDDEEWDGAGTDDLAIAAGKINETDIKPNHIQFSDKLSMPNGISVKSLNIQGQESDLDRAAAQLKKLDLNNNMKNGMVTLKNLDQFEDAENMKGSVLDDVDSFSSGGIEYPHLSKETDEHGHKIIETISQAGKSHLPASSSRFSETNSTFKRGSGRGRGRFGSKAKHPVGTVKPTLLDETVEPSKTKSTQSSANSHHIGETKSSASHAFTSTPASQQIPALNSHSSPYMATPMIFGGYSNPFATMTTPFLPMPVPGMPNLPASLSEGSVFSSGNSQPGVENKSVPDMAAMMAAGYAMMPGFMPVMGYPPFNAPSIPQMTAHMFAPEMSAPVPQPGATVSPRDSNPRPENGEAPLSPTSGLSKFC